MPSSVQRASVCGRGVLRACNQRGGMQRQSSAWVDAFAFGPLPMEGRYADPSDTPDDSGGTSSARAVVADSPRARRRRDAGRVPW